MIATTYLALPFITVVIVLTALTEPARLIRGMVLTLAVVNLVLACALFVRGSDTGAEVLSVPPLISGLLLGFLFGFLQQSPDRVIAPAKAFAGLTVVSSLASIVLAFLLSIQIG